MKNLILKAMILVPLMYSVNAQSTLPGVYGKIVQKKIEEKLGVGHPDVDSITRNIMANKQMNGKNVRREIDKLTGKILMKEAVEAEKRRVAAAAKKEAEEAARFGEAARRIQEGAREYLAYKEERAEYAERERIHQAEIMIASGIFSEDMDELRLGGIRTAARNILGKIEVYMDFVTPLCREAYQAIKNGEADPAEMPPHMGVYKEILERVVPDDRPWVTPRDVVMEQDEETIRATIESVDEILAKAEYGRVARGIKRFNGLDPEANLADSLPRG